MLEQKRSGITMPTLGQCCRRSISVSLVVGTTLSLVNQTACFTTLVFQWHDIMRIFLNYAIPFTVATYSRYALLKELENNP